MEPVNINRILQLLEKVKREIDTTSNDGAIDFIEQAVNDRIAWMSQEPEEGDEG